MLCPRCRHENPPRARYCLECGARVALECPHCGIELPTGAKFCLGCGQSPGPPSPGDARDTSPESYTPKHLAEKILTSRSGLEGERKQVTVLFADVKGSMELLADRDPEDARALLDPVLARMMDAVHRYEGTVNQVMGDGIMALFGAPLTHEDHAVRACYAALDMQAAIRRYAEEVRGTHGVNVQIRVGLNSGEVVVRAIASDLRMDYTAVGQTTHLAARMEQLADPGAILLTAGTLRLAEGYVEVKPLGLVPVKGLDVPVEVYVMTGAGPRRSRLHAVATRGLTRFVGREAELEQLRRALARAAAGHGQVVAIVGEPGVGKSRLVWEITRSHRTHGWLVLQAGAVSYGRATPHLPVVDLLKGYFQLEDREDQRKVREKVTGKLLALDRALEPSLAAFLALLDLPSEGPRWAALEPLQRRQRTIEAIKRLLLRESHVQPLLVVFEDLHWIDSETQALLDSLVESVPTARMLLFVNYRPEHQHRWGSKTYYTQLQLDTLPAESAEELLGALLGADPGLQSLQQLLIERTEGNPLFLEESVRTLVEMGALAGVRGAYRLEKPVTDVQIPATVQVVLSARIDRLPPEEKRLLQTASVIGHEAPLPLLQAIAGLSEPDLQRGLASLQAAEFLYETGLFPDVAYTFKHALTHEVTYASLLQESRRALHARIVDAIEGLYGDRLAEQVDQLAHHAQRGQLWAKAVSYLRQAGAKAAARWANREAAACFEQTLRVLGHLPESRDAVELAIDLRLDLRSALWPLGKLERIIEAMQEAEARAETLRDRRRLGRVKVSQGAYYCLTGHPDRALESGHRGLSIAKAVGDPLLEVTANGMLGWAHVSMGRYRRALEFYRQNVATLKGDLAREQFGQANAHAISSLAFLVWSLAELGEFAEGQILGEEAARLAESAGVPFGRIQASFGLGLLHLRRGDVQKAMLVLERGLEVCNASNLRTLGFHGVASFLGAAYTLAGRVAEALSLLEDVVAQTASMKVMFDHLLGVVPLGEAYLLAGRLPEALEQGTRGVALAREHGQGGAEAWALRLLGESHARRDPPDLEQAQDRYQSALALASELEMRPLVAHCHLGLGRLHRRTGHGQKADEHLTTAASMFGEMAAGFWLEQARAALAPRR